MAYMVAALYACMQATMLLGLKIFGLSLPIPGFLETGRFGAPGLLYASALVPRIVIGPSLALIADRLSPSRTLCAILICRILTMALFFSLPADLRGSLFPCASFLMLLSLISALHYAVLQRFTILGEAGLFTELSVWLASAEASLVIFAPLLGSLLNPLLGYHILLVISILFLPLSLGLLIRAKRSLSLGSMRPLWNLSELNRGWGFILSSREMFSNLLLTAPVNFFLGLIFALIIARIGGDQKMGPIGVGLVLAMIPLGQPLGGYLSAKLLRSLSLERAIGGGLLIMGGLGLIPFAFSHGLPSCCLSLILSGAGLAISNIANNTVWQRTVPDSLLGRVVTARRAVHALLWPLGALSAQLLIPLFNHYRLGGTLFDPLSILLLLTGLCLIALGLLSIIYLSPSLPISNERSLVR